MAELYDDARSALARGEVRWMPGGDKFRVMLVDTGAYPVDLYSDRFFSDVPEAARLGAKGASGREDMPELKVMAPDCGKCAAKPVRISGVAKASGLVPVVFVDSGRDETSRLILVADEGPGLPLTTAGGVDVVIEWPGNVVFEI